MSPRAFLIVRGHSNWRVDVLTVEDLTDAIGVHVHLFDTAELLAEQAWVGEEAVFWSVEVSEVRA